MRVTPGTHSHKPTGTRTEDPCRDASHSPHAPQRCQRVGVSPVPPETTSQGPDPALELLLSLEWRAHVLGHRSSRPAHASGTAQPGPAAGQGFTEQLLFPAHSPTPPSLEKQIPTPRLFPNKLRVSAHGPSSRTRPTAAGSESRRHGRGPARDPHAWGQRPSPTKQRGPCCSQAPQCPPASALCGQATSPVLG